MNSARSSPTPSTGNRGDLLGVLGEGQVDVEPRREGTGAAGARLLRRRGHSRRRDHRGRDPFGDRPLGAVDGDELAVAQHGRGVARAHHGRARPARARRWRRGRSCRHRRSRGRRRGAWLAPSRGWSSAPRGPRRPAAGRPRRVTAARARPRRPVPRRPPGPARAACPARPPRQAPRRRPRPSSVATARGRCGHRPWPTPCPGTSRSGPRRPTRCAPARRRPRRTSTRRPPSAASSSTRWSSPSGPRTILKNCVPTRACNSRGPSLDTT